METDETVGVKLIEWKLDEGCDQINILIKVDEVELSKSDIKAFFEK